MKTDRESVHGTAMFRTAFPGLACPSDRSGAFLRAAWLCLALSPAWGAPVGAEPQAGGARTGALSEAGLVPEDPQAHWETRSVRELMQQDLRDALRSPSDGTVGHPAAGPVAGVRPVLEPRLVALYGVGQVLMAEVQVGRRAYLYVRGQAWPAGHAGDPGVYQLRGMNGACVQIERGEDRHSLCLRMLLGEARP
ncbi:hypothetical protein ACTPOE_05150 [Castellaniella sp. WN]